ncbi:MAG: cell division protein FtsK [Acidobacteria bacterium]|nr:MAG: cell division protein FtsK [Acidobacteriota bacterium]
MATTQTDARARTLAPRNTRLNEIVAIALFALGVLLLLCLVFFNPNDNSLNSTGTTATHNLVGPAGAYVSDALLQTFGLAAFLLPLLLFALAWRRFRTRRLHAPLLRVVGLVTILLASSSLLALFSFPLLFDHRVRAGGMMGTLIADTLAGALHTVGASVLLTAIAATGVLLATNFSFARAFERIAALFSTRFNILHTLPARFRAWRAARRTLREQRAEQRRLARVEREAAAQAARAKSGADRVAEFMRETETAEGTAAPSTMQRAAAAAEANGAQPVVRANTDEAATDAATAQTASAQTEARANGRARTQAASNGAATAQAASANGAGVGAATRAARSTTDQAASAAQIDEDAEIEEMVATASVVRTDQEDENAHAAREDKAARAARRAEQLAAIMNDYRMPPIEFLNAAPPRHEQADEELRNLATRVAEKCREFNVTGRIEYICPGPVVTTYEFKPDPGVKYSRVTGLVDDLCLALKAESIRIDRVPGKAHVGIEVPNQRRDNIMLREVIESRHFQESPSRLTLALGKTIDGLNYVADLARMPHLLIAGATGTGKSVCLNTIVLSIIYKSRPDEVKFIMIDPKRLELGLYADIPHLATPIITEPKRAAYALKWAVAEMERRYKQLAQWGVRNIDGYNQEIARRNMVDDFDDHGQPWQTLAYLVIIIDELADLMMVSGHEVEEAITRLAQMARAVGIHLVLATQRPSVDVITGLIKANFPSRIAFRVSSKVDSRTIIDANGAEQLLGRGDMLFLPPGTSRLVRVHGAFVDESEIGRIVAHVKAQGQPLYDETITQSEEETTGNEAGGGEHDELFEQALRICVEMKRASTSVLQRRLRIGYGRAAAILDAMEREGFIGPADGARPRAILGRAYETVARWEEQERNE